MLAYLKPIASRLMPLSSRLNALVPPGALERTPSPTSVRHGSSSSTGASGRSAAVEKLLEKNPDDVVITFAKRTALGRAKKGQFKDVPVDEMLRALLVATLQKTGINPATIDDICVGTCHPPSPLYVSRAAALAAGIPPSVPISTVNRLCSSGLMSVRNIAQAIKAGDVGLGLAVGVENMTLNPRPTPEVGTGVSEHPAAHDSIQPMGWTSERVAEHFKVPRKTQDEYALISHTRAQKSVENNIFADEILPITLSSGMVVSVDDTVRPGVSMESLSALKPVFPQWGPGAKASGTDSVEGSVSPPTADPNTGASTTAGNASGVGDGAAVVVLTTRERAGKEGWKVLGKWVGCDVVGVEPRYMGISPVFAIPAVLERFGLTKEEIDVYEINEAFASQFAYCVKELGISMDKINPNGGSIALTHPVGMTGTRQIVTGLAHLERTGGQLLCTSMCVGSGMGAAAVLVRE
jgi:acetyl-CoA acyltransferase 1